MTTARLASILKCQIDEGGSFTDSKGNSQYHYLGAINKYLMKKTFILITVITLCGILGRSQNLLLQADSFPIKKGYSISFLKTYNKKDHLFCYVINILQSGNRNSGRVLYVFKVFTNELVKQKRNISLKSQIDSLYNAYAISSPPKKKGAVKSKKTGTDKVVDFQAVKGDIDNALKDNLFIKADLSSHAMRSGKMDYQIVFDNLTVAIADSIYYFDGSVLLQYFNLYDFKQITPLQSSQTIINTNATVSPLGNLSEITGNQSDSVFLYPKLISQEFQPYDKMYLIELKSNLKDTTYEYCRLILRGIDDYLHRTEFFTYKPRIGITGFKGTYIYKKSPASVIMRFSYNILDFEPIEYLKL